MKLKIFSAILILVIAALTAGCVSSFDECVEAGNPVMESYPRQCSSGVETFTEEIDDAELLCTSTGGSIETSLCCKSVESFPNSCLIGACACAPDHSHNIKTCSCGDDKCFDTEDGCIER